MQEMATDGAHYAAYHPYSDLGPLGGSGRPSGRDQAPPDYPGHGASVLEMSAIATTGEEDGAGEDADFGNSLMANAELGVTCPSEESEVLGVECLAEGDSAAVIERSSLAPPVLVSEFENARSQNEMEKDPEKDKEHHSSSHAPCPVCSRSMPVTKKGVLRVHGPISNRCKGSGTPPLSCQSAFPSPTQLPTSSSLVSPNSIPPLSSLASSRILKRIPRGSRIQVASKLASVVLAVVEQNNDASWDRLFRFCSRCLRSSGRGGHRRSLATEVNKLLREEADPPCPQHSTHCRPKKACSPLESLAARVSTKLEEGDFRGAIRLACSEASIAEQNEESLAALRAKHPPPHPDSCIPSPPEEPFSSPPVSEVEVRQAILSFPNGSAGGPDGLRPQHLKDLTGTSAGRGGKDLLRALTSLINLVLAGRTPTSIRPFFFGATLIALQKKEGGVRPIAVGNTLRRLAAKCAGFQVAKAMGILLAPLQLGYGTSLGCEAAAHAARTYLHNMELNHLMLKLDFKNAFNCLRRDKMLEAVRECAPALFHFVHSVYERPSSLFFGSHIIQSAEGVQQGDPLGPLLFCLTIHPLVLRLQSEFRVFYLDDGTLAGNLSDVLQDFHLVESEAANLGLQLNCSKSELICEDTATREFMLSEVPNLQVVDRDQARLLGSHIGSAQAVGECINEKIELLRCMGHRLCLLQAQDALLLLRHSLAIPKVLYILRTSPCFLSSSLEAFDSLLRSLLSDIINVHLNDAAWIQASLPVKAGGIGIRSAVQLAPSAYLASAAGCASLVHQILPPHLQEIADPTVEAALAIWSQALDQPPLRFLLLLTKRPGMLLT